MSFPTLLSHPNLVPVYAVGGWSDGYTEAITRLLAGLPGPRKGLISRARKSPSLPPRSASTTPTKVSCGK